MAWRSGPDCPLPALECHATFSKLRWPRGHGAPAQEQRSCDSQARISLVNGLSIKSNFCRGSSPVAPKLIMKTFLFLALFLVAASFHLADCSSSKEHSYDEIDALAEQFSQALAQTRTKRGSGKFLTHKRPSGSGSPYIPRHRAKRSERAEQGNKSKTIYPIN